MYTAFRVTYDDGGEKVVDKNMTVCKRSATCVVYANSNKSNMLAHMRRLHQPAQGVEEGRQDNFISPQLLNSHTVSSWTGPNALL